MHHAAHRHAGKGPHGAEGHHIGGRVGKVGVIGGVHVPLQVEDACIAQNGNHGQGIGENLPVHGKEQRQEHPRNHHAGHKPQGRIHMQLGKPTHLQAEHIRYAPVHPAHEAPQADARLAEEIEQHNGALIQKSHPRKPLPGVAEGGEVLTPHHVPHLEIPRQEEEGVHHRQTARPLQGEVLNGDVVGADKPQQLNAAVEPGIRFKLTHDAYS